MCSVLERAWSENMKRLLRVVLFVITAAVLAMGVTSCGDDKLTEEALIGTWNCTDNSQSHNHEWSCRLLFLDGGRFIDNDGDQGDFRITNGMIEFRFDVAILEGDVDTVIYSAKLNGDILTISYGNGSGTLTLRKEL